MKKCIAILLVAICVFGMIGCSLQRRLTLDKVVELSAKGDGLTWSDFEGYKSIATGSGLYILIYDIDDVFQLIIGGNTDEYPMYIRLVLKADTENYIDIRHEDVKSFIEANQQ